jgi:NitT/TauT family transport system permease protein
VNRSAIVWIGRAVLAAVCVGLWQLAANVYGNLAIASLGPILARLAQIALDGSLVRNLAITGAEAALGMLYGAAIGIVLPVLLAGKPRLETALDPFLAAAMGVPKLALAPLIVLWFGTGFTSKVVIVAAVAAFLIFFNVRSGIRAVEPRFIEMARIAGASRGTLLREVYIPSVVPFFLAGLQIAAPRAVSAAVVGEFLAANKGIGSYIRDAMSQADTVGIFAGVIVVSLLVVCINLVVERSQQRSTAYRDSGSVSGF